VVVGKWLAMAPDARRDPVAMNRDIAVAGWAKYFASASSLTVMELHGINLLERRLGATCQIAGGKGCYRQLKFRTDRNAVQATQCHDGG
jgi:hypothetical protein